MTTLQQRYESAAGIVVARIPGCATGEPDERGYCGERGLAFDIVEMLKGEEGDIPPGKRQLHARTTCDVGGEIGKTYLLFLDADAHADLCSGSRQLDGAAGGGRQQDLQILREYRDGVSSDLSGPWTFSDNGRACRVDHQAGEVSIGFEYVYDGMQPVPDSDLGRNVESPLPGFSVVLVSANVVDPTLLEVAGVQQALSRHTSSIRPPGAPRAIAVTRDLVTGDAVMELLERMTKPVDVVIAGSRGWRSMPLPAGVDPVPFRVVTRTTRLADSAAKFRACVAAHAGKSHCFMSQAPADSVSHARPICVPAAKRQ